MTYMHGLLTGLSENFVVHLQSYCSRLIKEYFLVIFNDLVKLCSKMHAIIFPEINKNLLWTFRQNKVNTRLIWSHLPLEKYNCMFGIITQQRLRL
jgi:hypothetical protein